MATPRSRAAALLAAGGVTVLAACSGARSDGKRSSSLDSGADDSADASEVEPQEPDAGEQQLDAGSAEQDAGDEPDAAEAEDAGEGGARATLALDGEPVVVSNAGSLCGLGFDSAASSLWVLPCFGANLLEFSTTGEPLATAVRPGEAADDGDLDVPSWRFQLAGTVQSVGTVLFTNGETGTADVYPINPDLEAGEPLVLAFGASHTVGGSLHFGRQSFFAVQDRVPGGSVGNVIAELDVEDGTVIGSFSTLPSFDVNYGDVDVCQSSGNLLVVSSNEPGIGEFAPDGTFLGTYPLPSGVGQLSGIGVDDATGTVWVSSTTGSLWHLTGAPCEPTAL